jgi:hypothetical protein
MAVAKVIDADRLIGHALSSCESGFLHGETSLTRVWRPGSIHNPRRIIRWGYYYSTSETLFKCGIPNMVFYSSHAQRYKIHNQKRRNSKDMRIQKIGSV